MMDCAPSSTPLRTVSTEHDQYVCIVCTVECVLPGAGAFEVGAHVRLSRAVKDQKVDPRAQLGVQAFADAMLVIPKTLAANAGYDPVATTLKLVREHYNGNAVGVDLATGEPMMPADAGVWDNYVVKKNLVNSAHALASNLILVDEVMRAGMTNLSGRD